MGKLINTVKDTYSVIPNHVFFDARLGFHARGVLCTLLSLPNGWNFSVPGLKTLVTAKTSDDTKGTHIRGDGYDGINLSLQLLEKLGYLRRIRTQGDNGKFIGYDYLICIPPEPPEN